MPTLSPIELFTPRLKLRWMSEADTDAHYTIYRDPEVTRYLSHAPWTDRAQAERAIATQLERYAQGSDLRFGIALRATGQLIGNAGLFGFVDSCRRCEVGYVLGRTHWGQGYAFEALRALLGHGFDALDLNRVEADIDPLDTASGRVLEKLGFRREGEMPERWIVNGEPADTAFYGLLRRYWSAGASASV